MAERPMVLRPMLAKSANGQRRLIKLCDDDRYWADQKIDGHRLLIHAGGGLFHPSSRTGMTYDVPAAIRQCFAPFVESDTLWIFDGEYLPKDRVFWIFDLPEVVGQVSCDDPFEVRRLALENFVASWQPAECVQLVPIAKTTEEKLELVGKAMAANAEGVMFKLRSGKYREGKRCEDILKVKFRFDVDCIVTEFGRGLNEKREVKNNMVLTVVKDHGIVKAMYDRLDEGEDPDEFFFAQLIKAGHMVEVAECTRLAGDGSKVKIGDVVQVKCLYVTDDNRLYQPTLPKIRTDKRPEDCGVDQLEDIRPDKRILK